MLIVRTLLFVILSFALIMNSYAQRDTTVQVQEQSRVSGVLLEKGTGTRLSDVNVKNLNTNQSTRSNIHGVFYIEASTGDSLQFTKVGYGPVKSVLNTLSDILIEMQSGVSIETVVINRKTREGELQDLLDQYRKKGVYNQGKNTVGTYLGSPATAIYNLFSKDSKNARRFKKYIDREEQELKVDRIFNKELVKSLTGLQEEKELEAFMSMYRPSYTVASSWGQYELYSYITRSFERWEKDGRPKPQPLPKLDIPKQEK